MSYLNLVLYKGLFNADMYAALTKY